MTAMMATLEPSQLLPPASFSWFDHPNRVCMSYWTHACHSLGLAWLLGWASMRAVVHAVVPSWYVTSTTDCVVEALQRLVESGCHKAEAIRQPTTYYAGKTD